MDIFCVLLNKKQFFNKVRENNSPSISKVRIRSWARDNIFFFILLLLLSLNRPLLAQTLKNGKFYCKMDTSSVFHLEEYTLTLLEVNSIELVSIKTNNTSRNVNEPNVLMLKKQVYTGYWQQAGDTIEVGLDFLVDSVQSFDDYVLYFVLNNNNLKLLKTSKLKDEGYSDIFYGNSIWVRQNFNQKKKVKIRAKF